MKKVGFSIPVLALLVGVALGYCFAPKQEAAQDPNAANEVRSPARGHIAEAENHDTIKALRARIRALESQLTTSGDEIKVTEEIQPAPRTRGESMRENLEKWRREHPEEYARMEERTKAFQNQRIQGYQKRLDSLATINTASMNKQAKENHDELQALLAARQEQEAKVFSPDLSDEERIKLFQEIHATDHDIRERSQQERANLLQMTAETLGFAGDDAAAIVETIDDIYEMTSDREFGFMMGRDAGPRGGPGGPRGGRGGNRGGRGGIRGQNNR